MTPFLAETKPAPGASATIEELRVLVAALMAENRALKERVAELERRLGLDSANSGKPPSSDGLKREARGRSLREPSGKKSGGQKGHEGKTLRQVDNPDEVIDYYPEVCANCGTALDAEAATEYQKRQVFDLPKPQPIKVTEHRAHSCRCAQCGTQTKALFPDEVTATVPYGAAIAGLVVYLPHWHFIPEDRLAELMKDVFGVELATAPLAAMAHKKAHEWSGLAATIGDYVNQAPVKHLDETGFRIAGLTQWLQVAATSLLTFSRATRRRGDLLVGVLGIIVHEHGKPYFTLAGVLHALCNAHHLRELRALIEIEKEPWAAALSRFLCQACPAANLARRRGTGLTPSCLASLLARYDRILATGLAFHEAQPPPVSATHPDGRKRRGRVRRRVGHNLLVRLQTRKEDVLRFLTNPDLPFTNNQA
ncbi:MAG: IS66 family transposase, partial [Deltaproteobacteria bacterium]|nr:IS66 family transposase [Deltaproteobacteria bacterium]